MYTNAAAFILIVFVGAPLIVRNAQLRREIKEMRERDQLERRLRIEEIRARRMDRLDILDRKLDATLATARKLSDNHAGEKSGGAGE